MKSILKKLTTKKISALDGFISDFYLPNIKGTFFFFFGKKNSSFTQTQKSENREFCMVV